MTFHIITLFPGAFRSYLGESILKRAIEDKKIVVKFYNPRDFTDNKWRRIDRAPYGGGPGMVIQAEPVIRAVSAVLTFIQKQYSYIPRNVGILRKKPRVKMVWLSPSGRQFTSRAARKYAQTCTNLIIICGRYEGIDARVKKVFRVEEISVGPYILTGGELAAEILIDAIARQVPGVLGDAESLEESRIASPEIYTRPKAFTYKKKKYRVPKILLTGHHARIAMWRRKQACG